MYRVEVTNTDYVSSYAWECETQREAITTARAGLRELGNNKRPWGNIRNGWAVVRGYQVEWRRLPRELLADAQRED